MIVFRDIACIKFQSFHHLHAYMRHAAIRLSFWYSFNICHIDIWVFMFMFLLLYI